MRHLLKNLEEDFKRVGQKVPKIYYLKRVVFYAPSKGAYKGQLMPSTYAYPSAHTRKENDVTLSTLLAAFKI